MNLGFLWLRVKSRSQRISITYSAFPFGSGCSWLRFRSIPSSHFTCELNPRLQACLRPRDRFWGIPVPKIDSAFDNLFVPQPSWSPSIRNNSASSLLLRTWLPYDWTPLPRYLAEFEYRFNRRYRCKRPRIDTCSLVSAHESTPVP